MWEALQALLAKYGLADPAGTGAFAGPPAPTGVSTGAAPGLLKGLELSQGSGGGQRPGMQALSGGVDMAAMALAPETGGLSLLAIPLMSLFGSKSTPPSGPSQPVNPPRPTSLKTPSTGLEPQAVSRKKSSPDSNTDPMQMLQLLLRLRGMMNG